MTSATQMQGTPLTRADLLKQILQNAVLQVTAELSCAYYCVDESAEEVMRVEVESQGTPQTFDKLIVEALRQANGEPHLLNEEALQQTSFRSALLLPLQLDDETIGALVFFSIHSQHYTLEQARRLDLAVSLAQNIIQNIVLQERLQQARYRLERQQDDTMASRLALLDAITDGVAIVLPQGDIKRVLTVNTRFTALFGVSNMQARNLTLDALIDVMRIPRTLRQELAEPWLAISATTTQTQEGQFVMPGPSGSSLDIRWYTGPVMQHERVRGRIYTFHDVTSENAAARLRAAWLQRVSHELRTPLTSISGFAQFILEETGDQLPDLAREYTEIILNSARHLNRVFSGMIEISRADAGELPLHRTDAHLPDVIIETIARLEFQYKERGLKVVMELDDDLAAVSMDIDRIAQVLTNILNNAIQVSPKGSRIRVSTKAVASASDLPPSAPADVIFPCVMVSVVDQGHGLTKEEAEKVFEPFFRTGFARARVLEGSGLGLTLARSFIEAHRGKIWAEPSTKRRGHTGGRFFFVLPQ